MDKTYNPCLIKAIVLNQYGHPRFFLAYAGVWASNIREEMKLQLTAAEETGEVPASLTGAGTHALLSLLSSLPDGVLHMDQHLEGLVETSLNLGILRVSAGDLYAEYLVRSSLESRLDEVLQLFTWIAEQAGASLTCADRYPAWQYVADSAFREKAVSLFE